MFIYIYIVLCYAMQQYRPIIGIGIFCSVYRKCLRNITGLMFNINTHSTT